RALERPPPLGQWEEHGGWRGHALGERARAVHPEDLALRTEMGGARPARPASSARNHRRRGDPIAHLHVVDARANLLDFTTELVTEDHGRGAVRAGVRGAPTPSSQPQMPTAATRSTTSPASGRGLGTSRTSRVSQAE